MITAITSPLVLTPGAGESHSFGSSPYPTLPNVKTTRYFEYTRQRPDRQVILDEWIEAAVESPLAEQIQEDGRVRRWVYIESMHKYLRIVLLPDGETVHNAFFDRGFRP